MHDAPFFMTHRCSTIHFYQPQKYEKSFKTYLGGGRGGYDKCWHLSTHPSSYPPIYKVHTTPHPTPHPTRVTLPPASHCGHSGHSYVSSPSSNIPSQRNCLFAQKNGVQTLLFRRGFFNVAHCYLACVSNICSFICYSKAISKM